MSISLKELRQVAPHAAVRAPDVSQWSVGMHLQHVCLAMINVFPSLIASEPPPPRSRFDPVTKLIFATGWIPRGRGKSPELAVPREGVRAEELLPMLDECDKLIETARAVPADFWYRHFAFGVLDRDRTLKFVGIHNRHHLKIIQDILRA